MCLIPVTFEDRVRWEDELMRRRGVAQIQALIAAGMPVAQPEPLLIVQAREFYKSDFARALGITEAPKYWWLR